MPSIKRILIVTKRTKYEYERDRFRLSHAALVKKYQGEHANLPAILESHEKQLQAREKLKGLFPKATIMRMDKLKRPVTGFDLVISFGGDNSFSLISHFVKAALFMGINSDPGRSTGAMCSWSANDLEKIPRILQESRYCVEEWPRLQASLNGKKITPATSEYFIGEKMRKDMTRQVLVYRGKEYEQKHSGMIIATGVGSTGWYDSACRYIFPKGNRIPRTEKKALFVISEPYLYRAGDDFPKAGELLPGEELVIYSLNDGEGMATADCWEEFPFIRGTKAVVKLSDRPLRVVVPVG